MGVSSRSSRISEGQMRGACIFVLLVGLSEAMSVDQSDLTQQADQEEITNPSDFSSNSTLWKKQRDCLEFCGDHGRCVNGNCQCEQPFCGQYCSKQCQHGGVCNSGTNGANRCLCPAGWVGQFCEIVEPGTVDPHATQQARKAGPHHDKMVMARVVDGGRLPAAGTDECDSSLGSLSIPFPADIDILQVVSVQVICVDSMRRKMYFGVNDPSGVPVAYGKEDKCRQGTQDLAHETLVRPREASTDFRYFMEEGNIVVEKLGASADLERCNMRASITYFP